MAKLVLNVNNKKKPYFAGDMNELSVGTVLDLMELGSQQENSDDQVGNLKKLIEMLVEVLNSNHNNHLSYKDVAFGLSVRQIETQVPKFLNEVLQAQNDNQNGGQGKGKK